MHDYDLKSFLLMECVFNLLNVHKVDLIETEISFEGFIKIYDGSHVRFIFFHVTRG
jgi:hypothetical protein